MKIQFEFNDRDAKAISFLTALLTAMKAEQQPEQADEEQASGNQEQESGGQNSRSEESGGQGTGEAQSQGPAATKDAAFSALREFISANGGEAAKALLGEFGVARFGELDEAHYGALIARLGA
jgi:hypothetical protein